MKLKLYQIDAFADGLFKGNPAAVVPLEDWLPDNLLQNIALENNLSETAFFVKDNDGFKLRWFTVAQEVDLCGHATLATAYLLFNLLDYSKDEIHFSTKSGKLTVKKSGNGLIMDFPAIGSKQTDATGELSWLKSLRPIEVLRSKQDLMAVLSFESEIASFKPDWRNANFAGHRGLIVTAKGNDVDFVSRCFYPELDVEEDPVTGSAHCQLAPYWAQKLHKTLLKARQLSKRGGNLLCEIKNDRDNRNTLSAFFLACPTPFDAGQRPERAERVEGLRRPDSNWRPADYT